MPIEESSQERPPASAELEHKAQLLRESPLFVNPSDGAELVEKQMIFLALAGLKPVSEAMAMHYERDAEGLHSVADDPQAVGGLLEELGLAYHITGDEHCTMAVVSLQPELVDRFVRATGKGSIEVGRLLGFPESAVTAYAERDCLPAEEQDQLVRESGLTWEFVSFRFSREHWREELEVARQWYGQLSAHSLG